MLFPCPFTFLNRFQYVDHSSSRPRFWSRRPGVSTCVLTVDGVRVYTGTRPGVRGLLKRKTR